VDPAILYAADDEFTEAQRNEEKPALPDGQNDRRRRHRLDDHDDKAQDQNSRHRSARRQENAIATVCLRATHDFDSRQMHTGHLCKQNGNGRLVCELNKSGTIQRACGQAGATHVKWVEPV
jgi:hypothetical protein